MKNLKKIGKIRTYEKLKKIGKIRTYEKLKKGKNSIMKN